MPSLDTLITFLPKLAGLGPDVLALLGAFTATCTALYVIALGVARLLPATSPVAHWLSVFAIDVKKAAELAGKIGSVIGKIGRNTAAGAVILLAGCTSSCTPAQRAALHVPALSQIDSIGMTVARVAGWCEDAGADVSDARKALDEKDPYRAIEALRKSFALLATAGHPVPPEVVAAVNVAEGALAAQAVAEGMRALSRDGDAGAP